MAGGVPGMRDDQRHPMPRGSTLVAEENSAYSGAARPSVSAAPAEEDGPITAVNDQNAPPGGPGPAEATDEFGRVHGPGETAEAARADDAGPIKISAAPESGASAPAPL